LLTLKTIFWHRKVFRILLVVSLGVALVTYAICSRLKPRYSMVALVESAALGASSSESTTTMPLMQKNGSSMKQDAMAFLEFHFVTSGYSKYGSRLTEVREQKNTELIQLVAEGPEAQSIELFLSEIVLELQKKYEPKVKDVTSDLTSRVEFLNKEVNSLEKFRAQLDNAIRSVGPSPTLVTQLMDINHDLAKLKQNYLDLKALLSNEKLHNFKMDSIRQTNGGAAIWPKKLQVLFFAELIALILTAYGLFLRHQLKSKYPGKLRIAASA